LLKEEQVAELLKRVEQIMRKELPQIRGNLRNADTRDAAIWELLVLEAASYLGSIQYEPATGGSPDVCLHPPQGRDIWIEAAFLHPRFWQKERQSNEVVQWLHEEAERRGIPSCRIYPRFDGKDSKAGPVRELPAVNERKKFLKEPELVKFFGNIASEPTERHNCTLSRYTVSIWYSPNAKGPYRSSSGLQQEAPKVVEEHAIYRVLIEKAGKQKVAGPKIICIGSDQSPALSPLRGPGQPGVHDAVRAAFSKHRSISAAIIISIRDSHAGFGRFEKRAYGEIFLNRDSNERLTEQESGLLRTMNFNRWKYTFPLQNWGKTGASGFQRASGSLTSKLRGIGMEIEVPANILVDALAGKTNLFKEFRLDGNDIVSRALNDGWVIESCSLKPGNIEAGEAPKIVIGLSPPILTGLLTTKRR
jgi:hypothetical protein